MSDNYFVLSALDTDQQGIGGSSSTDGFHYGQDAVIGIQKSTDDGTLADIQPNENNLTVNSITLSSTTVEPNTAVTVTFNVTNNSRDDYDGDICLSQEESGDYYLIDLTDAVIPAGETCDCSITFTPTEAGTYVLGFAYVNSAGEYIVCTNVSATLTVAQAYTNGVVPIYGYWADSYSRSQFVIAEADLQDMVGADITAMTFTASEQTVSWGTAKFDVYLSPSTASTISSLQAWTGLQKVYAGRLSVQSGKMTVAFSSPYRYEGGNLLVGFNQTTTGTYSKSTWHGKQAKGCSVGGYGSTISQQNFLPDVEFTYDFSTEVPPDTPTDFAVTYTGGLEALASWTSDAPQFDLDVDEVVSEDVPNPCKLINLEWDTTYIIKVRARNSAGVSPWTEPLSFTTSQPELVLSDTQDNTSAIASLHGEEGCTVTLQGRTFPADGSWTTICLPFNLRLDGSPLAEADARALNFATRMGESVLLCFSEHDVVTDLTAGQPYLIRWPEGTPPESPVFTDVRVDRTVRDVECDLGAGSGITFAGTYGPLSLPDADRSILLVGNASKLIYPEEDTTLGPQRGWFQLQGISPEEQESIKTFRIFFGEDDPTDLTIQTEADDNPDAWYDLSGRRLPSRPARQGIYITAGRKLRRN